MKPFIGITTGFTGDEPQLAHYLRTNYTNEVKRAGGIPVIFPLLITPEDAAEYVSKVDGIVFSGGPDFSPYLFNEDPIRELINFSTVRDDTEFALFREAQSAKLPILGICRGCQVINVAMGGSLFQDIPRQVQDAIGHNPSGIPSHEPYHRITILPGESRIASILKVSSIRTNSFHHQSVKQVGKGLRVTARTSDGVVEALEGTDPSWYVHCLQFHPEGMCERHPEFRALFTDFINNCRPGKNA